MAPDGSLELVINAYKTDGHTAADTYYPAAGDYVLGLDTTLRVPLAPNATLAKFGFQPEVLGTLLGLYRRALQTVFDDRNASEYLFFSVPASGNVVPVQPRGAMQSTVLVALPSTADGRTAGGPESCRI